MPRMRTIEQATAELKAADPCTAFTKTALRQLITTGTLPSVRIGNKYLVCMEVLESYLKGVACA